VTHMLREILSLIGRFSHRIRRLELGFFPRVAPCTPRVSASGGSPSLVNENLNLVNVGALLKLALSDKSKDDLVERYSEFRSTDRVKAEYSSSQGLE